MSHKRLYDDPFCECGNEKAPGRVCCDTCAFLDGVNPRNGTSNLVDVIHVLRTHEVATLEGVMHELDRSREAAHRSLMTLKKRGRVKVIVEDGDASPVQYYVLIHPARP